MFTRKPKNTGTLDGGEGRGVPIGGRDEKLPNGYRSNDEDDVDVLDRDYLWEEGDPADRRRDPLRH